jgi:hypothetical protein
MKHRLPLTVVLTFVTTTLFAGTFVVPSDDELVQKSAAIATGIVEGSYAQETNGTIETIYEVRVERTVKGAFSREELLRVATLGGVIGDRGVLVPGEAKFQQGEHVLLFLTRDGRGRWRPTDMTLGKFKFTTSTAGERLLVRDMEDVVGWDRAGNVHNEKVRREEGFLRFVNEKANGRAARIDYMVEASAVTLQPDPEQTYVVSANATSYPAATYTSWVSGQPVRWPTMSAGVKFYKRSDQNIAGAADGGVAAIQSGLAAWTNECGSLINLVYSGQVAQASANHDSTNVVEFNDPQQRVAGSWGGSGTIAITFLSFAGEHSFNGGTWLNITDADVVFQDGYPATQQAFAPAMTHELGHGIGWRHSNQNHQTGGACNSAVEECATAAIMNSVVSGSYGYNLQPWDVNAAQSVYPGGTCGAPPPPSCTAPVVTQQPQSTTVDYGTTVTLTVAASGTAPLTYQWYYGNSGDTSTPVQGANGSSLPHVIVETRSFWVRVSNSCGAVNSTTATVTVRQSQPPPMNGVRGDFNYDGLPDLLWRNRATGENYVWFMNGTTPQGSPFASLTDTAWRIVGTGDFDGDGKSDVVWRHATNGQNYLWYMNGVNARTSASLPSEPDVNWEIVSVTDFNADGRADLLWRNRSTGQNRIWLMNNTVRSNVFALSSIPDTAWRIEGTADLNRDGWPDIIWRNYADGSNYVWLMNGVSAVSSANMPGLADLNWHIVAIANYTSAGVVDLVWRNYATGENYLWVMSGPSTASGRYFNGLADTRWEIVGPR